MGKKFNLLLGAGIGYLLGAKAGRERYEKIRRTASKLRNSSLVGKPLDRVSEKASEAIRRQGEAVTDKVADMVKERLFGGSADSAKRNRSEYVEVEIIEDNPEDNLRETPRNNPGDTPQAK